MPACIAPGARLLLPPDPYIYCYGPRKALEILMRYGRQAKDLQPAGGAV